MKVRYIEVIGNERLKGGGTGRKGYNGETEQDEEPSSGFVELLLSEEPEISDDDS